MSILDIEIIYGEEKPKTISEYLSTYFKIPIEAFGIQKSEEDSTKYIITYQNENSFHYTNHISFPYIISDPGTTKTTPDCLIQMKGDNKDLFIEITKTEFNQSGNNALFQRFTKFIPVLKNKQYKKIYYLDNKSDKKLTGKKKISMRAWKTCHIEIITNNPELNMNLQSLEPYSTIFEFIEDWNSNSCPTKSGLLKGCTQKIIYKENKDILLEDFNIKKNGNLTHDPGIGTLLLVSATLCQFPEDFNRLWINSQYTTLQPYMLAFANYEDYYKKDRGTATINDIQISSAGIEGWSKVKRVTEDTLNPFMWPCSQEIENNCISQQLLVKQQNKLVYSIQDLSRQFQKSIQFTGINLPYLPLQSFTGFGEPSTSEKIVSIDYELSQKNVLFANHARSEREYLIIDQKDISIPKNILIPDIIYADEVNKSIYFVEAEKYENYYKGYQQIQSWRNPKDRLYFKDIFKNTSYQDYEHKAYIILYQNSDTLCEDFTPLKYGKYILNKNRQSITNPDFNYFYL